MFPGKFRIGTRRSALALYQTHLVASLLQDADLQLEVEIVEIDTRGDLIRDRPLPEVGGKGLFTQAIEDQLLTRDLELAVHSLKDLPSDLGKDLVWAGSPLRAAPTDALISRKWNSLENVPAGGTIATGSVRRRAQLASLRPDLNFVDLRGNIDTRLQKLEDHGWDGIIMATAALHRLELSDAITQEFEPELMVPAVGQGAIGLEIREGREDVMAILEAIIDKETTQAVRAERAFMRLLEGGCSAPVAAHCVRDGEEWVFRGWVGSPDGKQLISELSRGEDAVGMAKEMAQSFLAQGATEIIRG